MKLRTIDYLIAASSLSLTQKSRLLRLSSGAGSKDVMSDVNLLVRLEKMELGYDYSLSFDVSYSRTGEPLSNCIGVALPIEEIIDSIRLEDHKMGEVMEYLTRGDSSCDVLLVDDGFFSDVESLTHDLMQQGEVVNPTLHVQVPLVYNAYGSHLEDLFASSRRSYNGNPLSFFKSQYQGEVVNRTDLRGRDAALYRALQRSGQIDEAFPVFRGYSSDDREAIISVHGTFGGNAVAASMVLGKPRRTISKIWTEAGLASSRVRKK